MLSVMAQPEKETTSFDLSFPSKRLHRTSKLSLSGDSRNGHWIPEMLKLNTARRMASTFHLTQHILTAVTAISGISAMKGWNWKNPANEPNYDDLLVLGVTPEKAPDEPEYITLNFEKGIPTAINGQSMKVSDIIRELNRLGGKHGIGIIDIVENRVVGMKSRGVYETPGGTILMEAHTQLEELTLDRDTLAYKKLVATKFADLVYEGKWFCPLREALQAFVEKTQETVTGEVKLKLYKGNIIKAGTTSPYSLYSESLASFTTGDLYDHKDATGFINLFGLSMKVRAMLNEERKNNDK